MLLIKQLSYNFIIALSFYIVPLKKNTGHLGITPQKLPSYFLVNCIYLFYPLEGEHKLLFSCWLALFYFFEYFELCFWQIFWNPVDFCGYRSPFCQNSRRLDVPLGVWLAWIWKNAPLKIWALFHSGRENHKYFRVSKLMNRYLHLKIKS